MIKIQNSLIDIINNKTFVTLDFFINIFCAENDFLLLKELKNTEQDKIWHSEGNVHIHTDMVLKEAFNLIYSNKFELDINDKISLILSAVFHDIAKPITTKEDMRNGILRVISPKHEDKGADYLATRLMNTDLDFEIIKSILGIVKYHQVPKSLIIKNNLEFGKFLKLSLVNNLKMFYLFCKIDFLGRISDDKESQLEYLELFKSFAEDYKLFSKKDFEYFLDQSKQKINSVIEKHNLFIKDIDDLYDYFLYEYSNEIIFTPEESVFKYFNKQKKSKVIIFSGISGSGKSTSVKDFNKNNTYNLISLDKIRYELTKSEEIQSRNDEVLRVAYEKLKKFLRNKDDCIFDATNLRFDFRNKIIKLCDKYDSLSKIYYFQSSKEISLDNISNRERKINIKTLEKQETDLQYPNLFENFLKTKYIDCRGVNFNI